MPEPLDIEDNIRNARGAVRDMLHVHQFEFIGGTTCPYGRARCSQSVSGCDCGVVIYDIEGSCKGCFEILRQKGAARV